MQIEEERALRMIDATRQKADKILRTRAEQEQFRRKLESVKEQQLKERKASVQKRNTLFQSQFDDPALVGNITSGSIISARVKVQENVSQKH